jgi:cell division septation protein DedD
MEQFNHQDNGPVKEKSVYLLHLDGPRILILSALIIGLITIAVLVGMKITDGNKSDEILAQNDALVDSSNALPGAPDAVDPLKEPIPDLQPSQNPAVPSTSPDQSVAQNTVVPVPSLNDSKKVESDILTGDTVHSVVPPSSTGNKHSKKKIVSSKRKSKSHISRKRNRDEVVEVSSDTRTKSDSHAVIHGFVLQIASYDRSDSAKNEVRKLKEMDYDAYYDKTQVKGKDFFRVRIGPIASKDKALQMLDEIQENPRYEESFMTKE